MSTSRIINFHAETQSVQRAKGNQSRERGNLSTFAYHMSQENKNSHQPQSLNRQTIANATIFNKENIQVDKALFEKSNTAFNRNETLKNASVQQINQSVPASAKVGVGIALELKRDLLNTNHAKRFNVSKMTIGAESTDIIRMQNANSLSESKYGAAGFEQEKLFNVSKVVVGADRADIVRKNNYNKARIDYQRTNEIGMLSQGMDGGTSLLDMARNSVSLRNLQAVIGGFSLSSPDYLGGVAAKGTQLTNKNSSKSTAQNMVDSVENTKKLPPKHVDNSFSLGSLSAKFESGSDGISSIGFDRNGGTSYGKYQIASRVGSMDKFLDNLDTTAPDIAERLRKAGPADTGSRRGGMPSEWKKIAEEQPERFEKLQEQFIYDNYYKPALDAIAEKTSIQEKNISPAMEEVIWSTAIQHGPSAAVRIFDRADNRVGDGHAEQSYNSKMISTVYELRTRQFGSSTEQVRKAVHNRLEQEKLIALDMLEGKKINLA